MISGVPKKYHGGALRVPWGHQATAGGFFHGRPLIGLVFIRESHMGVSRIGGDRSVSRSAILPRFKLVISRPAQLHIIQHNEFVRHFRRDQNSKLLASSLEVV